MFTIYGKDGEPIGGAKFDESFIETLDSDARKDLVKSITDSIVERDKSIQETERERLKTRAIIETQKTERDRINHSSFTHIVDSALPIINGWVCRYGGAVRRTPCDPDIEEEMMNELDLFPPDE